MSDVNSEKIGHRGSSEHLLTKHDAGQRRDAITSTCQAERGDVTVFCVTRPVELDQRTQCGGRTLEIRI